MQGLSDSQTLSAHYTFPVLYILPKHLTKSGTYFSVQKTEQKMLGLLAYFKGELLEINYYVFLGQANTGELDERETKCKHQLSLKHH